MGEGETEVTSNVVLVPIATLGCGKTTIAGALVKLFDFGHIQNDNIEGKSNRPGRFAMAVTNALAAHKVVIADRNNHQRRERQQIINDVGIIVPAARFVALHYVHDPKDRLLNDIRKITRRRILDRGDNHQTIHAASKGQDEIVGIMEGFLNRFQGCDTSIEPDCNFEEVIDLDVTASSLENLETVITRLYNAYPKLLGEQMPSQQDMSDAIDFSMDHTVTVKHDLSFNPSSRQAKGPRQAPGARNGNTSPTPQNLTPDQLVKKLEYFGIAISTTVINSTLGSLFNKAPTDEAQAYNMLKQSRRLQSEFHVTLMHRASSSQQPEVWEKYSDVYQQAISKTGDKESKQLNPSLGPARVRLERVVWDERIMAIVVRILPQEQHQTGGGSETWPCANAIPHITIGTARPDVKPKESNDLLGRWMDGNEGGKGPKIWEKEIPGLKVLEGTVKAVLQRGR